MSKVQVTTNFKDNNGVDLGNKLVSKDYLISVYPEIGQRIGIPPELWVWGLGVNGQLGNAQITNSLTPVTTFSGGVNWKQVSCGLNHTAAIKTDGTLWTWGYADDGKLGNRSITGFFSTPITTFAGGTNWKQVSCGGEQTAAIKTDGTLWTWGSRILGLMADASSNPNPRSTPGTTFAGGNNWKQVSAGQMHTAAIKTDGTLWVWGFGSYGQLGIPETSVLTAVTTFAGGTNWKQVSCGSRHTAAIKTDGTLWIWGRERTGALGNGRTVSSSIISTPITTFAGGNNWKMVDCSIGYKHYTAAIKTDGTLWTWGDQYLGALGNATTTGNRSTPSTTFAGGTNWKQVSAFVDNMTAIKTDGTLWAWGRGLNGNNGNGQTLLRSTPVTTFAGGTNWKQVSQAAAIQSVDFSPF